VGYYVRFLTPSDKVPTLDDLRSQLGVAVKVELEAGDAESWEQILIKYDDERPIVSIERLPVSEGTDGQDVLDEFLEETKGCKPASAARWLAQYLPRVRTLYVIQFLRAALDDSGRPAVDDLLSYCFAKLTGIVQADGEGFSNEAGDHILWQFRNAAKGKWTMAVLNSSEQWVSFQMDLANPAHREAFWEGRVPPGITPIVTG
jgi:hypothetical protein